ncbi:MAG: exopolysaccharide biosynthesis polyprenyl glycosylphosphotransferase [Proteobacteria bacterium]|nr:exopolysaccharide biosynthesis polyprenyl glycosylphosphotransferase [Pseudomonadota bacterium]
MSYITLVNTINDTNITKRLFDIIVSAIIIILLSPLLLIIAFLIKYDSKGPVFFSQERVGKDRILFKMWKFRSMYIDAEERKAELMKQNEMQGGVLFKMKNDPRITNIGRFIRKFSIDELPQLWDVLVGNMSLVGPRPSLLKEVEQYTPYQCQRLKATPGITCTWQVSGRSDIPFRKQVELDLEYIEQQSFINDIIILVKTVPAVIKAKGSY